jgi:hypothetical protein
MGKDVALVCKRKLCCASFCMICKMNVIACNELPCYIDDGRDDVAVGTWGGGALVNLASTRKAHGEITQQRAQENAKPSNRCDLSCDAVKRLDRCLPSSQSLKENVSADDCKYPRV